MSNFAEKLTQIAEKEAHNIELNGQLEQILYGTDTGGKSFYDEFWDTYQKNGAIYSAANMFAHANWNDITFKPKYSLEYINGCNNMFNTCGVTDLCKSLEEQGVYINFSNCTGFSNTFAYMSSATVPEVDTRSSFTIQGAFQYSRNLRVIKKLILRDDGKQIFNNAFLNTDSLEDIVIEGVIGQNGFDVHWSTLLSKESITSIINALSTTTSGLTVTLSKTAVNNAFGIDVDDPTTYPEGSEWYELRNSKSNWTISYA